MYDFSYDKAIEEYGEKMVEFFSQYDFSETKKYTKKICDFYRKEQLPLSEISKIFHTYQQYEKEFEKDGINYNDLSWPELYNLVLNKSLENEDNFKLPNQIYNSDDNLISVGYFGKFEDVFNYKLINNWCITKRQIFEEHHNDKNETLYIIKNLKLPKNSICKFVVAQVFPDGKIKYWTSKDTVLKDIDDGAGITRSEYEELLGDAVNYLKPMITNND